MKIFVFGSSLTSTYWNGAATYYRGVYKNLHRLGHEITFAEPDIYDRQSRQDAPNPDYARVRVYETPREIPELLREAEKCHVVIKHSGVGAEDALLEHQVLRCQSPCTRVLFWDVDAPATLARLDADPNDPFHTLIPAYDAILTYGGGDPVLEQYRRLGARNCRAVYNALDPDTHYAVPGDEKFGCDLVFVGHRLPDRERRVEEYFLKAALLAPELSFVLGGEGWGGKDLPNNVRWIGHVSSKMHNLVNCSARMVLNVNRDSMAQTGFSPPTRIFEAAGAGACVVTDLWNGVDQFFRPGAEILTASSAQDVVNHLRRIDDRRAREIGLAMKRRALRDHSYASRAVEVDRLFVDMAGASILSPNMVAKQGALDSKSGENAS
jgi:spore maturation protein CgeB